MARPIHAYVFGLLQSIDAPAHLHLVRFAVVELPVHFDGQVRRACLGVIADDRQHSIFVLHALIGDLVLSGIRNVLADDGRY